MSITDLLQPIKDRLNAATPGPWEIIGGNEYLTGIDVVIGSWDDGGISLEDATFLSSAPTDQARLIAAVEAVAGMHVMEFIEDGQYSRTRCEECLYEQTDDEQCPTVAALTSALESAA